MKSRTSCKITDLSGKQIGFFVNDRGVYKVFSMNNSLLGFWDNTQNKAYDLTGECISEGVRALEDFVKKKISI
jgi:hypothetical protein